MSRFIILIIAFLLHQNLKAQINDTILPIKDAYILKYDKFIQTKLSLNNDIEFFEVSSEPLDFIIKPNTLYKLKLNADYKFISFAFSLSPKFIPGNNDNLRKGETNILAFGLNLNFNHWKQGLSFNQTKGFYIANSSDFIPDWNTDTTRYIQFPELEYLGFSGYTAYSFNPNFSFSAYDNQTEKQVKSTGSFVPKIIYRYYIIDNKIELTPTNSSQKSDNIEAIILLGYYYTLVIKSDFYLTAGINAGGGLNHTNLLTRYYENSFRNQYTDPILNLDGIIAFGYNSNRFFSGIEINGSYKKHSQHSSSTFIVNDFIFFQVFLGYRFNPPKVLQDLINKINF